MKFLFRNWFATFLNVWTSKTSQTLAWSTPIQCVQITFVCLGTFRIRLAVVQHFLKNDTLICIGLKKIRLSAAWDQKD